VTHARSKTDVGIERRLSSSVRTTSQPHNETTTTAENKWIFFLLLFRGGIGWLALLRRASGCFRLSHLNLQNSQIHSNIISSQPDD